LAVSVSDFSTVFKDFAITLRDKFCEVF